MGIRMFEGRRKADDAKVTAALANRGENYVCYHCRVPVGPVKSFKTKGEDKRLVRVVPAFFRLRKGEVHSASCQYSVIGSVEYVADNAQAVEDIAKPFETVNGKLRFRLNIPVALAAAPQVDRSGPNPELSVERARFNDAVKAAWTDGKLDPYCRSAVGLAAIWNAIEGSASKEQFRDAVTLADKNEIIEWSKFSYSFKRYELLANRLMFGKVKHPVAVLVVPQQSHAYSDRSRVQCAIAKSEVPNLRIAPTLWLPNNLANQLVLGKQYIVFGYWQFKEDNPWSPPEDKDVVITYRNISVNVQRSAQFALFDVSGEE